MIEGEELLSLAEAARRCRFKGSRGRTLQKLLQAKERKHRRQIMIRMPGNKRTHLRVTMALMRRWCPEAFQSKVDSLQSDFRTYLKAIDQRIEAGAAAHVTKHVEPRLVELFKRDEKLAGNIDDLMRRVATIAGR